MLKEALANNPQNTAVQLKLLSIYANRKDVNAFSGIARQVKNQGDQAAWAQAAVLGYSIDPSNPMYEEGKGAAVPAAQMLAESGKPASMPLDMDVGFGIPMDLDVTAAMPVTEPSPQATDFDVSVYDTALPVDAHAGGEAKPGEHLLPDFDVTGGHPIEVGGAMDFDVTGSHPDVVATQHMDFDVTGSFPGPAAAATTGAGGMEFDISAPSAQQPEPFGGEGLAFDVGAEPGAAVAAPGGMDFDVGAPATAQPEPFGAGGLTFDLGEEFGAPAAAHAGGGLDFDISASQPAEGTPFAAGGPPFDLGQESGAPGAAQTGGGLDFDISIPPASAGGSAGFGGQGLDVSAAPAASARGLDFDISSHGHDSTGAQLASTVTLARSTDFDVSAPMDTTAALEPYSGPSAGAEHDFDLNAASSVVAPTAGRELAGGVDLELDTTATLPYALTGSESATALGRMDLDLGAAPAHDLALGDIALELGAVEPESVQEGGEQGDVENKLELARAFQEMGDVETARELLGEVLKEGNARQIESAQHLIQQL